MKFLRRVRCLFHRDQRDRDMAAEMRAHIEEQTERNIEAGLPGDEARAAAHRQFGGVAQIQERARDVFVVRWFADFVHDVRFGARFLWRSPGFTVATTITLALGTAAVALVGIFFSAVIWSDLPHVPEPARVVTVMSHRKDNEWRMAPVSGPKFLEWRERAQSFAHMAAYAFAYETVSAGDRRDFKQGLRVDAEFFPTLGVQPAMGRTFSAEDIRSASPPTVVISDDLWTELFQRNTEAVGGVMQVGATEYTVIGVMPPRFEFPHSRDFWLPLPWEGPVLSDRKTRFLEVIARLRAGVTLEYASREMAAISAAQAQAHPDPDGNLSARVIRMWNWVSFAFRRDVHTFLVAALLLQALVSMNVGGLLFSRLMRRAPQTAMRAALGASRSRLLRETLTECLLLACAGLAAGLVLAYWVRPFAIAAVTPDYPFPRAFEFNFTPSVLLLSAGATLGSMLAIGLIPAWRGSHLRLADGVQGGAMIIGSKPPSTRLRSSAVVLQVSATLVLLVYCGLRLEEVRALAATDLGVDPDGVAMFSIASARARSPEENATHFHQLLSELRQMPGVRAAGLGSSMPGQFGSISLPFVIEGQIVDPARVPRVLVRAISPGTLGTLRIPLLQGRDFNDRDAEPMVLIDRPAAERFFPGETPLGRRIATSANPTASDWATIVGIVGTTQPFAQLGGPQPAVYTNWIAAPTRESPTVFVRAAQHPRETLKSAINAVRRLSPEDVVVAPAHGSYGRQIVASYWNFLWRANAMAAFASIAHLVAAVGIFGLVAYTVAERTREIGIRQALGATRGVVVRHIAWSGFRLIALGSLTGILVTLALGLSLPAWYAGVYKTSWYDTGVYTTVIAVLLTVGSIACWLPARRAAKVDPLVALRAE